MSIFNIKKDIILKYFYIFVKMTHNESMNHLAIKALELYPDIFKSYDGGIFLMDYKICNKPLTFSKTTSGIWNSLVYSSFHKEFTYIKLDLTKKNGEICLDQSAKLSYESSIILFENGFEIYNYIDNVNVYYDRVGIMRNYNLNKLINDCK